MSWIITPEEKTPLDQDYRNVSLLLHGDGTNGSTTIVDSSPSPKTVSVVGNTQINTTVTDPFGRTGVGVLAFDGSGDYLTVPDGGDFDFGTGDFTIEAWIYTQKADGYGIYSQGTTGAPLLVTYNGQFRFRRYNIADVVVASAPPAINTWIHVAVCRGGTSTRLFFNGVQTGATATDAANYTVAGNGLIGTDAPNNEYSYQFQGYIDDLRITKGVARYTSNFTPPTAPFPDAGPAQ